LSPWTSGGLESTATRDEFLASTRSLDMGC